jgi:TM2 domain-containing membrane protein YozV
VHPYPVAAQKSRVVAALLAFFLGSLGIHNFYAGYVGAGVAQLVLTLLGWATSVIFIGFFLIVPVSIWAFVEMILFLAARTGRYSRSADGIPLS